MSESTRPTVTMYNQAGVAELPEGCGPFVTVESAQAMSSWLLAEYHARCVRVIEDCGAAAADANDLRVYELLRGLAATLESVRPTMSENRQHDTADEVMDMPYCSTRKLVLHPGQLYRFTVDPTCATCTRMAAYHDACMRGENPESIPEFGGDDHG